ncbi:hypothetical protein [Synechococcus sp. M16CYN]
MISETKSDLVLFPLYPFASYHHFAVCIGARRSQRKDLVTK